MHQDAHDFPDDFLNNIVEELQHDENRRDKCCVFSFCVLQAEWCSSIIRGVPAYSCAPSSVASHPVITSRSPLRRPAHVKHPLSALRNGESLPILILVSFVSKSPSPHRPGARVSALLVILGRMVASISRLTQPLLPFLGQRCPRAMIRSSTSRLTWRQSNPRHMLATVRRQRVVTEQILQGYDDCWEDEKRSILSSLRPSNVCDDGNYVRIG